MNRAVARAVLPLAILLLLAVSCSSAQYASTSSDTSSPAPPPSESSSSTSPPVTVIVQDVDVSWSPAEAIPVADKELITKALGSLDLGMLFPSVAPMSDAASVSAQFMIQRTLPGNAITLELVVRTKNLAVLLSLISSSNLVLSGSGGTEVSVRDQTCVAHESAEGVSMLDWRESGRYYHAEFQALSLDEVLQWVASWSTLPEHAELGSVDNRARLAEHPEGRTRDRVTAANSERQIGVGCDGNGAPMRRRPGGGGIDTRRGCQAKWIF